MKIRFISMVLANTQLSPRWGRMQEIVECDDELNTTMDELITD